MPWWKSALITFAAVAAMVAIVPLMVLGGTGSWRQAWEALRQYLAVMGLLLLAGGGFGLLMILATLIG